MAKRKSGLGRGLDALFADAAPIFEEETSINLSPQEQINSNSEEKKDSSLKDEKKGSSNLTERNKKIPVNEKDQILYIDINDIKPNKNQPRKTFDKEKIQELAESIRENGVIQPLLIRKASTGYEIVAGERRWRASRVAGLHKIPCIIRDFDEKQNMIVAIIENMQREDLDAIEEAMGLNEMIRKFKFTQEQVSGALGKSRAYIANSLRLLKLPENIQKLIQEGKISAAHGRTIITVNDPNVQDEICKKIIKNGLSVRATERLVEKIKDDAKPERKKRKPVRNPEIISAEDELRNIFGTKVNINGNALKGKIELEYYSLDELNRLIEMMENIQ